MEDISKIKDPLAVRSLSVKEAGDLITVLGADIDEAYYKAVMSVQVNPDVKKEFGFTGGPDIKGCIFTSPMLGLYEFNGMWPKERFAKHVFKEYYNTNIQKVTHLLKNINDKFPPSIIIYSKNDFIKLHAYMFEKKAKELNLSLEHYCMTTGKNLMHISNIIYPYAHESKVAMTKIFDFVEKAFTNTTEKTVKYDKISKKTVLDREFMKPTVLHDNQELDDAEEEIEYFDDNNNLEL